MHNLLLLVLISGLSGTFGACRPPESPAAKAPDAPSAPVKKPDGPGNKAAALPPQPQPPEAHLKCTTDEDCACGTHKELGGCFYGNKAYVNEARQCPDFCSGMDGTMGILCIDSVCTQISGE